jgi:hypothetical protein
MYTSQFQLAKSRPKCISGFLDARGGKGSRAAAARAAHLQLRKFRSEATVNLDSNGTQLDSKDGINAAEYSIVSS